MGAGYAKPISGRALFAAKLTAIVPNRPVSGTKPDYGGSLKWGKHAVKAGGQRLGVRFHEKVVYRTRCIRLPLFGGEIYE